MIYNKNQECILWWYVSYIIIITNTFYDYKYSQKTTNAFYDDRYHDKNAFYDDRYHHDKQIMHFMMIDIIITNAFYDDRYHHKKRILWW